MDRLLKDAMTTRQTPLGQCPDAETLAAWADGTIYGAEADALESHLADCQRCQAVLATFAATEPADASVAVTDGETEETSAPVIPFPKRPSPLRWAVPLIVGTAAASLLMYTAWPKPSPLTVDQAATQSIARAKPDEIPQGAIVAPPPTSSNAAVQTPSIGPAPKQAPPATEHKAVSSLPAPLSTSVAGGGQLVSPSPAVSLPPTPAAALPTPVAAGATTEQIRIVPPAPAAARTINADLTQTLARADRNSLSFIMDLPGGGVEFGPTDPVASVTLTPTKRGEAPRNPLKNIRWRVLLSGMVEKTIDGGATWSRVVLDPAVAITSGASPSNVVCWLVGKAGAVMRSTDGGTTWTRVTSPDPGDLVSVTALDGQNATVATADGRRLTTADGGQTWRR